MGHEITFIFLDGRGLGQQDQKPTNCWRKELASSTEEVAIERNTFHQIGCSFRSRRAGFVS